MFFPIPHFPGILVRIFLLLGLGIFPAPLFALEKPDSPGPEFALTREETEWLKAHPVIRIGAMDNWPPFDFVDPKGDPSGIGRDLVEALNKRLGGRLHMHSGAWENIYGKACRKELDALLDITPNPEREQFFTFTTPYLDVPHVIIAPRNTPFLHDEEDLAGKTLALEQGFGNVAYFREKYPKVRIREYRDTAQALEAVARGEADAYAGNRGVALFLIEKNVMTNLLVHGGLRKRGSLLTIGIRKDWPLLRAILQKALDHVSALERREIRSRWVTPVNGEASVSAVPLTSENYAWLDSHPVIRVGIMASWPPMDFVDSSGIPRGIGVDFIKALNKRLEGRLTVVPGSWVEIYEQFQENRLDAIMDITPRKDRESLFLFTKPYATIPHVIVAPEKGPYFHSLKELAGKKVALEKNFFMVLHLERHYPEIDILEYPSTSDALDAVSKGEADAYVGNRAVAAYLIENELLTNLQIQGKLQETFSVNSMGIRKDWPELADILDTLLASLPAKEIHDIYRKWGDDAVEVILTPDEQAWLAEHPVITVGIARDWAPLEFVDESQVFQGMAADYLEYVGKMLGMEFEFLEVPSWKDKERRLAQKTVAMCAAEERSPQGQSSALFTQPYLSLPMVVFNREEAPYINDMYELSGKNVAVIQGESVIEYLKGKYPLLAIAELESVPEALRQLQEKKIDAYIGSILITSHYIRKAGLTNIKVAGQTGFVKEIAMAANSDLPLLAKILQKGLEVLPLEERQRISQKWMSVTYKWRIDYGLVWKILLGAGGLLTLFLFWNRRLAWEIRERRKAETALQAAKVAAEVATRAKSDFLANMSHEIRTPMNAIIGITHLITQTELTKKQHDYLSKLHTASYTLMGIINDVLDFSKIEAGRLDLESISFNLEEVFENLSNLMAERIQAKGLELLIHTPPEMPRQLVGDPLRLGQVLTNLTANAVKFTERGEIFISVETIDRKEHEISLRFSVHDTGIGISQEQQAHLFEAFSQADASTTRKYGGTGLGLAISKRLVTMMGGKIHAVSRLGSGSTFSFSAVFGLAPEETSGKLRPHPDLLDLRVLVIDDNPTSREILQTMLEAMSFRVTLAASGAEGIEELKNAPKEQPFQLVIVDWKMPSMDGFATCKEIRKCDPSGGKVKIIMVTAYGREDVVQRAAEERLEGFLIKPVNQSSLLDTVLGAFGKEFSLRKSPDSETNRGGASAENLLKKISGAHILLVEDNEINQQIGEEILKQAGFSVTLANHGEEAVILARREKYDLILMDIQMPVMDGFAATERIRQLPGTSGQVPIVAMTAHTMTGDREKSLAAGMNDHIGKPIDPEQLFTTLARWIKPKRPGFPSSAYSGTLPLGLLPGIDSKAGLARIGGNRELYGNLLAKFRRDFSSSPEEIARMLEEGRHYDAQRIAHTLKGVAGNIGAKSVQEAAGAVEKTLAALEEKGRNFPESLLENLRREMDSALRDLETLQKEFQKELHQAKTSSSPEFRPSGNPEFLRNKLEELEIPLHRHKPREAKKILKEINSYAWSETYAFHLENLDELIKKYDFKEAEKRLFELRNMEAPHD